MRTDQTQDRAGQFTHREGYQGEEALECLVACKVTSTFLRDMTILFDQNRKQWGWQTVSDMQRSLLEDGWKHRVRMARNPTPEMKRRLRQTEEMERMEAGASKHRNVDRLFDKAHREIETALQAGDLPEVRRMLAEFKSKTAVEDDPAIKQRREMEWQTRYERLWEGLNRNMSLRPKDFEQDGQQ